MADNKETKEEPRGIFTRFEDKVNKDKEKAEAETAERLIPDRLKALPDSPVLPLDDDDVEEYQGIIEDAIESGDVATIANLEGMWADYQIKNSSKPGDLTQIFSDKTEDYKTIRAAYENLAYLESAKLAAENKYYEVNRTPYIAQKVEQVTLTEAQLGQIVNQHLTNEDQLEAMRGLQKENFEVNQTKQWIETEDGVYVLKGDKSNREYTLAEAEAINKQWSKATGLIPLTNGEAKSLVQDKDGRWIDEDTGDDWTDLIDYKPIATDDEGKVLKQPEAEEDADTPPVDENLKTPEQIKEEELQEMLNSNPYTSGTLKKEEEEEDDPLVYIGEDTRLHPYIQQMLAQRDQYNLENPETEETEIDPTAIGAEGDISGALDISLTEPVKGAENG